MSLRSVMTLVACIFTAPAFAENANIGGYGAMPCATVLADFDNPTSRHGITQWALGFMSGINTAMQGVTGTYRDLNGLNRDFILGSLRAACQNAPMVPLNVAADKLYVTLPIKMLRP